MKFLFIFITSFLCAQNDSLNVVQLDNVDLHMKNYARYKVLDSRSKKNFTISFPVNSAVISLVKNIPYKIKVVAVEFRLNDSGEADHHDMYFRPILVREKEDVLTKNLFKTTEKIYHTSSYKNTMMIDVSDENIILDDNKNYYLGVFYQKSDDKRTSVVLKTIKDYRSETFFCKSEGKCLPVTSYNSNRIALQYTLFYERVD